MPSFCHWLHFSPLVVMLLLSSSGCHDSVATKPVESLLVKETQESKTADGSLKKSATSSAKLLLPQLAKPFRISDEPIDWQHESNLLLNASFEQGREPWYSLASPEKPYWMEFEVSARMAKSGDFSVRFPMQATGEIHKGTRIWGIVRELELESFPRFLSGWYRVEDWQRGSPNQYVQVVIMAFGVERQFPRFGKAPVQAAYVLSGLSQVPFRIANRKFLFAGPQEPQTGEWHPFHFDLHADFATHWGTVPHDFDRVRILFETRFDDPQPSQDLAGDVYFDDLYLGDGANQPVTNSSP